MKVKALPYILITVIMTAILIPLSWKSFNSMKLDTSIHEVLKTDKQSEEAFKKFNDAFYNNTIVVAVAKIDNLFSNEGAKTLFDLSEALQEIPDLEDIKSLTHSTRPVKGDSINPFTPNKWLKMKPFIDIVPKTDDEWKALKEFNTQYPMTRGILVSPEGNYATIIAVLNRDVDTIERKKEVMAQARDKVKDFIDKGITVKFLSESFISAEFDDLVKKFLLYFISLSLSLMALVIYISFKSWRILVLILLYQACGFLTFPIIFYLNVTGTNLFTFIIIPLVSTIQLTFLTHFYSIFQHQAKKEENLSIVLKNTLKVVFLPSFTALLTSMIGMGALCLSEVEILKTVGIVGMESLLLIFAITFVPPVGFCLFAKKEDQESSYKAIPNPLTKNLSRLKSSSLIISVVITLTAVLCFNRISPDIRAEEFLDPESETRQAIELLDEHFGGIAILQLEVKTTNANGIQKHENLNYLHQLRNNALDLHGVENAYTYSQFYTVVHEALTGNDLSIGNTLPTPAICSTYSAIINSFNFPFKHILQNEDRSETVFFLRTRHLPTEEYLATIRSFEELALKNRPEGVEVKVSDGIHTILESDQKIVKSQVFSASSSLLCIFFCLLIMWRSFKLAVAAVLCNMIPLATILLIMAIAGIPLNSITVMVSAIILGISVDDSIHFVNFFKNRHKQGMSTKEAISTTLSHKLRPMICTSLILTICLFLFLMAPFPPINQFGILGGCALMAGLISSCILLPASLLFLFREEKT